MLSLSLAMEFDLGIQSQSDLSNTILLDSNRTIRFGFDCVLVRHSVWMLVCLWQCTFSFWLRQCNVVWLRPCSLFWLQQLTWQHHLLWRWLHTFWSDFIRHFRLTFALHFCLTSIWLRFELWDTSVWMLSFFVGTTIWLDFGKIISVCFCRFYFDFASTSARQFDLIRVAVLWLSPWIPFAFGLSY